MNRAAVILVLKPTWHGASSSKVIKAEDPSFDQSGKRDETS
jgi:hypothetical protein